MKTAILAFCLLGAFAFAAPINEYIDPDCIEEDTAFEEPISDIDAEFALGVPDLTIGVGNSDNDEECEDDIVTEAPAAPAPMSEECVDDELPVYDAPEYEPTSEAMIEETTGAEECEDEPISEAAAAAPTTEAAADDCEETATVTEEVPEMMPVDLGDECDGENEGGAMNEGVPQLDIRIEPAMANFDAQMATDYGGEQEVEPIEECEEY